MQNIISCIQSGNPPLFYVLEVALIDAILLALVLIAVAVVAFVLEWAVKRFLAIFVGFANVAVIEGYLTFPGVVIHECSHALFAKLFGAKIKELSFRRTPLPDGSGYVLGSLEIVPRGGTIPTALQATMTGIAPALVGTLLMTLIALFIFPLLTTWWQWAIVLYFFISILLHSGISYQDIASAKAGIPVCFIVFFVIFLLLPQDIFGVFN